MPYDDNDAVLKSYSDAPMGRKKKKSDTRAGKRRKAKGMKAKGKGVHS